MSGFVHRHLAQAQWLDTARARGYFLLLAIAMPLVQLGWLIASHGGIDPRGEPVGTDFLSFWAASALALSGHPAAAYSPHLHHAAQVAAIGYDAGYYAFFYPPPYLLVCLPLALLPYLASLGVWLGATGYAYGRMLVAWTGDPRAWLMLLAFPAVLINAGSGQNGFLTAALAGSGLMLMQRRPMIAGFLLGSLIIKPHLAMLLPLLLAAQGNWRAFFATAASAALWMAASLVLFGVDTWSTFLSNAGLARITLEQGLVAYSKMQSSFAAVRLLGGSLTLAYGVQAPVTLGAAALIVMAARRQAPVAAQAALFALAAIIATPFVFDYDLTWLALPLGWLFAEGRSNGFRDWEKLAMALAFALPLASRAVAGAFLVPIAPFILLALLAVVARRILSSTNPLLPSAVSSG